jgi:Na+-transporting NADH:ubiquinone oxidoreductase subunit D
MANDTTVQTREGLFSKKRMNLMKNTFWEANPISSQVLGICSALAVTVKVDKAIVMIIALAFVLCLSNVIISLIRNFIPNNIRIIVFLIVIATAVVIIDEILKAYVFEISKQLSVYVGLIITNCIVMGRAEAFAMSNGWWDSFLDGLGNAAGYGMYLLIIAIPREIFGSGKLLGFQVIPQKLYDLGYINSGFMLLAPAAFILLGLFIWWQRQIDISKGRI